MAFGFSTIKRKFMPGGGRARTGLWQKGKKLERRNVADVNAGLKRRRDAQRVGRSTYTVQSRKPSGNYFYIGNRKYHSSTGVNVSREEQRIQRDQDKQAGRIASKYRPRGR